MRYAGYYRRSRKRKQLALEAFGNVCGCCGYNTHLDVLEFHHVDPSTKTDNVFVFIGSWKRFVEELRKCVLLCPTCHREVTRGHRKLPATIRRFDESYCMYKNFRGTLICLKPKGQKKSCLECGALFTSWDDSRKHCSRNCRFKTSRLNKTCPSCQLEFVAKRSEQTYCSQKCAYMGIRAENAANRIYRTQKCPTCKSLFSAHKKSQKYCSRKCVWNRPHWKNAEL